MVKSKKELVIIKFLLVIVCLSVIGYFHFSKFIIKAEVDQQTTNEINISKTYLSMNVVENDIYEKDIFHLQIIREGDELNSKKYNSNLFNDDEEISLFIPIGISLSDKNLEKETLDKESNFIWDKETRELKIISTIEEYIQVSFIAEIKGKHDIELTSRHGDEIISIYINEEIEKQLRNEAPGYIVNGDFERPVIARDTVSLMNQGSVPGWQTTASDGMIEIINGSGGPAIAFRPASGNQFAEINANLESELYQIVRTVPGEKLLWQVWHAGRDREDQMNIRIGTVRNNSVQQTVRSPNRVWRKYTGEYIVPAGQTETYFGFESINSATPSYGNFVDDIRFYVEGNLEASKNVDIDTVYIDDPNILTYTIQVKNTSSRGMLYEVIVEDILPRELELVTNSLKVNGSTVRNTYQGNGIIVEIDSLEPGAAAEITFQASVVGKEPTTITNTAKITHSSAENPLKVEAHTELRNNPESMARLTVEFVNELNEILAESTLVIEGYKIGDTIDLSQNQELMDQISELESIGYEVISRPNNETDILLDQQEMTVQYKIQGLLQLTDAPEVIDFGILTYDARTQRVENPRFDNDLVVTDTRAIVDGWTLGAAIKSPLRNREGNELINALRYVWQGEEMILDQYTQVIYTNNSSINGTFNISDTWRNDAQTDGPKIQLNANDNVFVGSYSGIITWKLMPGHP